MPKKNSTPSPSPKTEPKPTPLFGKCPVCRRSFELDKNGAMLPHVPRKMNLCRGEGMRPTVREFWAMGQKYNAFVFGGDVWQKVKYKVEGEAVRVGEFRCFVYHDKIGKAFNVHEQTSGGIFGNGKTKEEAIENAESNVKHAAAKRMNLAQQVKDLGPVENHPETDTNEMLRLLAKNDKK